MRLLLRRRRHANKPSEDTSEAIARLKRRCAAGATATGVAYLAVLTAAATRPTALRTPVTIGLLIGLGIVAALCTLGALFTWVALQGNTDQESDERRADDMAWAFHLGANVADAYCGASPESAVPRAPNAR